MSEKPKKRAENAQARVFLGPICDSFKGLVAAHELFGPANFDSVHAQPQLSAWHRNAKLLPHRREHEAANLCAVDSDTHWR